MLFLEATDVESLFFARQTITCSILVEAAWDSQTIIATLQSSYVVFSMNNFKITILHDNQFVSEQINRNV